MEISEIDSPESLQKWLEDKPAEWALIIGIRMVLRAAPLGFAAIAVKEHNLPRQQVENIVLTTFRMMFLAKVFCDYPAKAGKNIASDSNLEIIKKAYDYPDDYTYLGPAKFTLRALADFLNVLVSSSDQIPSIASAAKNACQAIRLGYVTNQNSPMYAASSSEEIALNQNFWSIIRKDADWINQSAPKSSLLMSQPLWLRSDNENFELPDFITKAINSFTASDLAQNTSFGLIADWYIAALTGKSAFGENAELAIAKMSPANWGDGDDERDCVAVMDRVADLAGWVRDIGNVASANTGSEKRNSSISSKPDEKLISQYRSLVKVQVTGILTSIERERVELGNIPNGEEQKKNWERKIEFLEKLENDISEINNIIPNFKDGISVPADSHVANQLAALSDEFTKWLNINRPEMVDWVTRLGSATTFIGMMGFLNANMTVATSAVLLMTCGEKVRDAILGDKKTKQ